MLGDKQLLRHSRLLRTYGLREVFASICCKSFKILSVFRTYMMGMYATTPVRTIKHHMPVRAYCIESLLAELVCTIIAQRCRIALREKMEVLSIATLVDERPLVKASSPFQAPVPGTGVTRIIPTRIWPSD